MKLWKYGGSYFDFNLWRWAFPIAIEINRFYEIKLEDETNELLDRGKLHSIEFKFALLCFHIEFMVELENKGVV